MANITGNDCRTLYMRVLRNKSPVSKSADFVRLMQLVHYCM